MAGIWSYQFEVVMRPLRAPEGVRQEVQIEARTAAQAARLATAAHPELKVVSVRRCEPGAPAAALPTSAPETLFEDAQEVTPRVVMRRVG